MSIKKLLLIPLLWVISFSTFASADSISFVGNGNSYTPNLIHSDWSVDWYNIYWSEVKSFSTDNERCNISFSTSDFRVGFVCVKWGSCNASRTSSSAGLFEWNYNVVAVTYPACDSIVVDIDSISVVSSDNDNSPSEIWWIPTSFTSWLTNLVNNFWLTLVNRLPTIILVALWIYAIFSLFRVVRNYWRSAFKW